jgi:hypothetical protein
MIPYPNSQTIKKSQRGSKFNFYNQTMKFNNLTSSNYQMTKFLIKVIFHQILRKQTTILTKIYKITINNNNSKISKIYSKL